MGLTEMPTDDRPTKGDTMKDMRGVYCEDWTREDVAKMTAETWVAQGFGNPETKGDPERVAAEVKDYKAQNFAHIWRDSSEGTAVVNGMTDFLDRNDVEDIWDAMTWEQQGVVYAALAYGLGMGEGHIPALRRGEVA